MVQSREQLIQQAETLGIPGSEAGGDFLRAEAAAVKYTEYSRRAIPTFAQTPAIARAYMRTVFDPPRAMVEFGIDVRRTRAKEAADRENLLYMTEYALGMEEVVDDHGNTLSLPITRRQRIRQLAHLAVVAQQPHIQMRLIPATEILPDFNDAMLIEYPNGRKAAAVREDGELTPLITSPMEIENYEASLAHLSMVALDQEVTLDVIREHQSNL